jgi:outer membrane protein TolC
MNPTQQWAAQASSIARRAAIAVAMATAAAPAVGHAQALDLAALQRAAVAHDARAAQRALLARSADLRVQGINDALKPQFTVSGSNSHASDVTYLSLKVPGTAVPIPPKDRWAAALDVSQVVYDGGAAGRKSAIERARLAEGTAAVDATVEPLRDEVARTYFAAALLTATAREITAMITDLDALLADTRARVREGAALGRDSAAVRAEWRGAQARLAQAQAQRRAAIANLARLTGEAIGEGAEFSLPDWSAALSRIGGDAAAVRERPEFARIARTRDRLDAEESLAGVENKPRVLAFAQGGYGRPGLNQFKPDPAAFWQAGVKVEWQPFTWGSAARNRELTTLQQQVLATEERALAEQMARAVQADLDDRQRLQAQLRDDEEVVALRELAATQADAQRREGAITAAEAVQLRTDVVEARLARERHRIELVQAEARIATTLGLSPR